MYPIVQKFITGHNRPGERLKPFGVVVHDTATPGATAENEQVYFQKTTRDASVHAFVDWGSIIQTIPWNEVAWGSGYTSNHKFLQIELCVPSSYDAGKFNEVWNRAVWLFAYLFINVIKVKTITKDNLMSHSEVTDKWRQTTHRDPTAYFAQYGKSVDGFRAAVQAKMNEMSGGDNMKTIVTYAGDSDVFSAIIVAQKKHCPLMLKADFDVSGINADDVIQIGGKPGSDRFSTFKDAASLL